MSVWSWIRRTMLRSSPSPGRPLYVVKITYRSGYWDEWIKETEDVAKKCVTDLCATMDQLYARHETGFIQSDWIRSVVWFERPIPERRRWARAFFNLPT